MRTFFTLATALILGATTWYLVRIENFKASTLHYLQESQPQKAFEVVEQWLHFDDRSHQAWLLAARTRLELYLIMGRKPLLEEGKVYIREAIQRFKSDPKVYEIRARMAYVEARMENQPLVYREYIEWMNRASQADPMNYYYYSILFEELMALSNDMEFLDSDFPKEEWLVAIGDALNQYLQLKDWYREEYLQQIRIHFTPDQQRTILSRLQ